MDSTGPIDRLRNRAITPPDWIAVRSAFAG